MVRQSKGKKTYTAASEDTRKIRYLTNNGEMGYYIPTTCVLISLYVSFLPWLPLRPGR
jgi:hypothetical protein